MAVIAFLDSRSKALAKETRHRQRALPATPAIFRVQKSNGATEEMCLTSIFIPKRRLPTYPDTSAMAPVADLLPWDACFFVASRTGKGHHAGSAEPYHLIDTNTTAQSWSLAKYRGVGPWLLKQAKAVLEDMHSRLFEGFPGAKRVPGRNIPHNLCVEVLKYDSNICCSIGPKLQFCIAVLYSIPYSFRLVQ